MEKPKIELVVTRDELLDLEKIAAEINETIDMKQWYESASGFKYLTVVSTTLFATFVAYKVQSKERRKK